MKPTIGTPEIVIEEKAEVRRSWEDVISDGLTAREAKDSSQWILGDLAVEVEKLFPGRLDEFGSKIGVSKETLRRYKVVSLAWPPEKRLPFLSHRHHQILAGRKDRYEWIEKAHDNEWSCERLGVELKKQEGKWEENMELKRINFTMEEASELVKWYEVIREKFPEVLTEISNNTIEKIRKVLKGGDNIEKR